MKKLALILSTTALVAGCASGPDVSPGDLRAPFQDNAAQIQTCYDKVAKKQPDLGTGTVELKFLINEDGKAYKTIFLKKRSTLQSKLLNACIKKVVQGWQFPTGKGLEVVYPFQFEKQTVSSGGESGGSAPKANEPPRQSELDVIDTSPPEEGSGDEGADESATPTE